MKQILLYTSFVFLATLSSKAQTDTAKVQTDTTGEKKITLSSLIPEDPLGLVSDFEKVFIVEEIRHLDSLMRAHERATSNQIAIVSLDIDEEDLKAAGEWDDLCYELMTKWGLGDEKLDNGVGIIFSVKLRKIKIVVGDGLRSQLTDKEAQNIINKIIVPEFRKAAYYRGILNALMAVIKELSDTK